ncbi:hypothetical protein WR25_06097 [Diploscapter pachys]|uniref:Uncharacterized protein n=1 Tax=Diploscapter pachys TaxID=2018661 RepID=A0A2A2M0E9_9BILA|nr:hypothetical protein WR25_06097 [Diploscapter pachys]
MPSGPKWLDHQHAQMYLWRHRSSATDNSETSVESVFSNDGDPMSAPRLCESPLRFSPLPLTQHISHLTVSPSSSSTVFHHVSPLHHDQLIHLHQSPTIQISEPDDVEARELTKETSSSIDEEQPLDLSFTSSCCTPSGSRSRPSVIVIGPSTSPEVPDVVQEHFRRSLSGKWPKKTKLGEDARNHPLRRRSSLHTSTVCNNKDPAQSVEEHFRRSLAKGCDFDFVYKNKQKYPNL